jgi:magnesium chelatase family protein
VSLAVVYSRAQSGIGAPEVVVEAHLSNGLPGLSIVGLPEAAVKESKDRVRSALLNARFEFPLRRITINLAPADLPKEGGRFDLPIAIGILGASEQIPAREFSGYEFFGELALSGELRGIRGILPAALKARSAGRALVVPRENAVEAALVDGARVLPAEHLLEVCGHLRGSRLLDPQQVDGHVWGEASDPELDLLDVKGQHQAKRALEVAAAGGHSLLMMGPPGTGKTMLASRLPGILPPLDEREAMETATVYSVSALGFSLDQWRRRPFRAPHHTASAIAIVGGGSQAGPGEISLAHNGVLFLDELPEFGRRVLEVLREPLESGHIVISRAARHAEFPARFQLVAAMNPCPCGYLGDPSGRCRCTSEQVQRYRLRLSGPLLDRIDMHVEVPRVPREALGETSSGSTESSRQVRTRVAAARARQAERAGRPNSTLGPKLVEKFCRLGTAERRLLDQAIERLQLSARGHHRILKLARTIADLAGCPGIEAPHLMEAVQYRRLDRSPAA